MTDTERVVQGECVPRVQHRLNDWSETANRLAVEAQVAAQCPKQHHQAHPAKEALVPAAEVKDRMIELSARKEELNLIIKGNTKPVTLLHPNMTLTYQAKLDELCTPLTNDTTKDTAREAIRSLVDTIILSPSDDGPMDITVVGDLVGLLTVATKAKEPLLKSDPLVSQVSMVAGDRNQQDLPNMEIPLTDEQKQRVRELIPMFEALGLVY